MKKTSSYVTAVVLGLASFALIVACGDDDANNSSTSSTSSSTSTSSSGSTSSSSSSSGSSSGDPAADAAKAACEADQKCFPNTFAAKYASVDECVEVTKYTGPAVGGDGPPGVDPACAEKQKTAACGETPAECLKGTLNLDAKCDFGGQCGSGNCERPSADCGTCKSLPAENDACPANFICGPGLRCDVAGGSKCVKASGAGEDCAGAAAGNCDSFAGIFCLSDNKCGKKRDIGGDCGPGPGGTASQDCRAGLTCKDGKCADEAPTVKDVGADCAAGDVCKGKSSCVEGKCTAYADTGADCALDGTKPFCDATKGLACKDGKCAAAETAEYCK
ncbi:MAG: hypothetical protein KIT84_29560 [Labilithrix sp.]|nr:hypothetical protein [Labilithrix sp.]MCW5815211.1 hypothetical protein [Labilithrix sp.]